MTGHPRDGAPGPGVKLYNQSDQSKLVMEIVSQWGNLQVFFNTGLGAFRQVLFNANAHLASTSAGRCVGR